MNCLLCRAGALRVWDHDAGWYAHTVPTGLAVCEEPWRAPALPAATTQPIPLATMEHLRALSRDAELRS